MPHSDRLGASYFLFFLFFSTRFARRFRIDNRLAMPLVPIINMTTRIP